MKVKNLLFIVFVIVASTLSGCVKEQYRGSQISEPRQYKLTDEYNNVHVRETKRILKENELRNEKKEKKDLVKRKRMMKLDLSFKNFKYRKKPEKFDFY